jgi:hypothetical protein
MVRHIFARFFLCSQTGSIKIWMHEVENGIPSYSCLATLSGHGKAVGGIASLAFIPPGVFGDDHPDLKDGALVCLLIVFEFESISLILSQFLFIYFIYFTATVLNVLCHRSR